MAAFGDAESSTGNAIEAGTLDLTFGSSAAIDLGADLAPNQSVSDTVELRNAGSVSGSLDVGFAYVENDGAGPSTRGADDVARELTVTTLTYGGTDVSDQISGSTLYDLATTDQPSGGSGADDLVGLADPGSGTDFAVGLTLADVGNAYQDEGIDVTATFTLTQTND
jgi:hypothetical protein